MNLDGTYRRTGDKTWTVRFKTKDIGTVRRTPNGFMYEPAGTMSVQQMEVAWWALACIDRAETKG
jgi:hypothetical protein